MCGVSMNELWNWLRLIALSFAQMVSSRDVSAVVSAVAWAWVAADVGYWLVPLQLIMAKTRHKSPRTAMRHVKPDDPPVVEVHSLLSRRRRRH
jgi:hypothetical protein